jgi:hypothetical protein
MGAPTRPWPQHTHPPPPAGATGVVECTYVDSNITDLPFFATKVKISTEGEPAAASHACCQPAPC